MSTQDISERKSLVEAIKTPLGFFSLVVLVAEAVFVGLALRSSFDRSFLLYIFAGILVLLILLVAAIAMWKPEALWGKRYSALEESFARGLGEELYAALDGHLGDIGGEVARERVYDLLRRTIASSPYACSKATRKFCEILVETIVRRAELNEKWQMTKQLR